MTRYDPAKHPRYPKGTPGGLGGEWMDVPGEGLVGLRKRSAADTWVVQSVEGDRVTVRSEESGIVRVWTRADLEPPKPDWDPVEDVDDEGVERPAPPAPEPALPVVHLKDVEPGYARVENDNGYTMGYVVETNARSSTRTGTTWKALTPTKREIPGGPNYTRQEAVDRVVKDAVERLAERKRRADRVRQQIAANQALAAAVREKRANP